MEKHRSLTPLEAWDDFLLYAQKQKISLGNDVAQAKRDRKGLRKKRDGDPMALGVRRIQTILERYAPGRYTFTHQTTVTLNEET